MGEQVRPAEFAHAVFKTGRFDDMQRWWCTVLEARIGWTPSSAAAASRRIPSGSSSIPQRLLERFRRGAPVDELIRQGSV